MPDRQTTTVSMAGETVGDFGGRGSGVGSGTVSVTTTAMAGPARARINATPEQVWSALHAVYLDLGIPVETIDNQNRRLGNIAFVVRRRLGDQPLQRFFDCGTNAFGGSLAETERLQLHVTSRVIADEGGSLLETDVRGSALSGAASGTATNCRTRGGLEVLIENRVRLHLTG